MTQKILDLMPASYKQDLLTIVMGYEGISGLNKKDNKYYPVQEKADKEGNLTIGIGHLLTIRDRSSRRFEKGITYNDVIALFLEDLEVRAKFVYGNLESENWQHFVAILSSYYNCGVAWSSLSSVYKSYKAKDYKLCAERLMLYCVSNNVKQLGLIRRRATEALYMLTGKILFGNKGKPQELQLYKELSALVTIDPNVKKKWGMK